LPKLALTCPNFPNLPKITQTWLGSAWLSLALLSLAQFGFGDFPKPMH